MLAADREVELVRDAERASRGMHRETPRAWRTVVASALRVALDRKTERAPKKQPATNE